MKRLLILCLFLIGGLFQASASAMSFHERECKELFDHCWDVNEPTSGCQSTAEWDNGCWDYISEDGRKWTGSAETRRLQREVIEKEKQRQEAERERQRKENERLAEKKKRKAEAAARRAKEEREQRQLILANHKTMPLDGIENFLKGRRVSSADLIPVVDGYFDRLFAQYFDNSEDAFSAVGKVFQRINSAGVDLSGLSMLPLEMIIVLSPEAREESTHEYDSSFITEGLPKPLLFKQIPLSDLVASRVQGAKPFVILNVAETMVERDVTEHETVESEYQVGLRDVVNPLYENRVRAVQDAQYALNEVEQAYSRCMMSCGQLCGFCALGRAFRIKEPRAAFETARNRLRGTSRLKKEPIFQPYSFRKSTIRIKKNTLVEVFATNANRKALSHSELSVSEEKTFTIAHGLRKEDRRLSRHKSGTSINEDALSYEKETVELSLPTIIENSHDFKLSSTEFSSLREMKKVISEKRTRTKENISLTANNNDSPKSIDQRFKSIVIVLHPDGGLGTGFYVNEDTVLTNYHVISGSPYLEIGLFDGSETFGKVVAQDIRLDLAILKVQKRRSPVKFYNGNALAVGATVDAIGHPEGLEFSLTRGTVSGIRRLPSYYDPGGKAVRFIQSDVAINPGNSGGPLFLGNYVVGVNDWKLAATELEGLSFSIHYVEVIKFLKKHGL